MSSEDTLHFISDCDDHIQPDASSPDIGHAHSKLLASVQTLMQHIAITEGGYSLPAKILFDIIISAESGITNNAQTPCKTLFQALLFVLKSNIFYYSEEEAKHLGNSLYLLQILVFDAENTFAQCAQHSSTDLLCTQTKQAFTLPTPLPVPFQTGDDGKPKYVTGWCFPHSPSYVYFLAVDAHLLGIPAEASDGVHVRFSFELVKQYTALYKTGAPSSSTRYNKPNTNVSLNTST